ncbi:Rust resistance kinase Lr10 [Dichanthelium oligosanthes]|uniref:non-specific serine/threonine protein kinase n=1 Tax=Dichanthelium oligosanthes TaxID=888268 RepID=A0A1E5UTW5_9POAL|nr:Rust resistance kinase Lr10 [Dichanthelium oligosanthes]
MIPLGGCRGKMAPENASFADVVRFMRHGFAVQFPVELKPTGGKASLREFLRRTHRRFRLIHRHTSHNKVLDILMVDLEVQCALISCHDSLLLRVLVSFWIVKWIYVLYRFVLAPLVVFLFLVAYKFWKTRITIDAVEKFLLMQQMLGPIRYVYKDITAITSHFRDKLGQGGYGSVYKGVEFEMSGQYERSGVISLTAIEKISPGRIHYVNIVRLMGFCSEEKRRALVYEGINYLHQGCDMQILHFDIKPHNTLLDNNFVPKVADFGLAKLFPRDNSFVPMSAMRGTIGYIAPEMVSRGFGAISSKSDVYSFGMLLLEMAGGRRNADPNAASSSQAYFPSMAYSRLTQQEVGEISDAVDMHELEKKLCVVGLWCIQMRPHDRPTMAEVIEMLEGGVDGLEMPPRPFFCDDDEQMPVAGSYYLSSELNTMLSNSKCNGEEFISEVATIGRIHHVNVVRLMGFCSEEMRRALVYEYMPNGSLDKYIFSSEKSFSWDKLNDIALGIARGINYLHQGCDMQILHFDMKPHNILLDSNFVPKIAGFGLAKLCPKDNSFVPMKPHDRPTMSEVIEMLEGGADALQMPPTPFFCDYETSSTAGSSYVSSEVTVISEEDD